MRCHIEFDFDAEGDPPEVLIVDEDGTTLAQVFEEPECAKDWSWDGADWEAGPLARKIVGLLNGEDV